jgi:hypothetical protein
VALRDLSKKRRGWRWELYKNRQGKIPKELLELFVDILRKARPNELPANPPLPVLTEAETETLRQNLNYISRFGPTPNLYGSEADSHDLRSPVIVKVKGDKYEAGSGGF